MAGESKKRYDYECYSYDAFHKLKLLISFLIYCEKEGYSWSIEKEARMVRRICFALATFLAFQEVYALGYVNSASVDRYTGWGCDFSVPNQQVPIFLWRDDGKFLGSTVADLLREETVGAACGGSHSAHGFSLALPVDSRLMDNKWHKVRVYASQRGGLTELNNSPVKVFFKKEGKDVPAPRLSGDVVGRDLQIPGISWAGHIGLYDGSKVIEVLSEGVSVIQTNSWENFKSRSPTWNTIYTKFADNHMVRSCWTGSCYSDNSTEDVSLAARYAVIARAYQVLLIGVDYTITTMAKMATPESRSLSYPYTVRPAQRGVYRCDTFVIDTFYATTELRNRKQFPQRQVSSIPASWASKIANLDATLSLVLPLTVFKKIRDF